MPTNPPEPPTPQPGSPVIRWLLDSDPSIRWQVLQDLAGASSGQSAAERARVAAKGWGAQLLRLQGPGGAWGGRE